MKLEVRGFRKVLPGLVIEGEFSVNAGERVVIAGPSGSGKTTLFRFIAGLDPLTDGTVELDGRDISILPPESREIGVVFQEPIVFPHLSLIENAAFGLRMRGVGQGDRRNAVVPWLERVGLAGRIDTDPDSLSGGEKQRLALVRALVWKPRVLLLDEPFSALDPKLRQELGDLLVEVHQKLTIPLILVTHDADEARRIGQRVIECKVLESKVLSETPVRHQWFEKS